MSRILIGLMTYHELPLLRQSMPAIEELRKSLKADVVVLDNGQDDLTQRFLEREYPQVHYLRHTEGNVGFGRGHNEILRRFPGRDFYLAHQCDLLYDPDQVSKILKRMEKDSRLTMAAGKLHFWDLSRGEKTRRIDSLGIVARPSHHFSERGSGELDEGQYDDVLEHFFGISGAGFLLRTSVIPKLHGSSWQLFDERFWMYKEDVDLAYRLRWLGEKMQIFPEVWGWHARTVGNREGQDVKGLLKADAGKSARNRLHSYKNHWLLLKNNWSWHYGPFVALRVFTYELAKGGYMFLKAPFAFLSGMWTLFFVPVQRSARVVSSKEMLKYFE